MKIFARRGIEIDLRLPDLRKQVAANRPHDDFPGIEAHADLDRHAEGLGVGGDPARQENQETGRED